MIDWWAVLHNSLWIAGLATILAASSVANYQAHQESVRLRDKLGDPGLQLRLRAGLVLFCLGLFLGAHSWWERFPWGLLTAALVVQAAWFWRDRADSALRDPDQASPTGAATRGRTRTRWLGWGLVLAGTLVIAGWGGVTAVQFLGYARSAQAHLQDLEELARAGTGGQSLEVLASAGSHLSHMRHDLEAAHARLAPFLPAARLLGWIPVHGADLVAAPDLLAAGLGVAAAGDRAFQALSPALELLSEPPEGAGSTLALGQQILPVLIAAGPDLQTAQQDLAAVRQARARINAASLSPRTSSYLACLDRYLPWFETAVDGALLAPALLGADGRRTYLVIAQNNQELRPTGGFISGVGKLVIQRGRLVSLSFNDSYAVDNLDVPHDLTPSDFQRTLFGKLWFFRDANWDADFPTSARRALAIYARDRDLQASGVIALDLSALRLLVDAIGPLEVAGIEEPVTGTNVMHIVQNQFGGHPAGWEREWWLHRKDFMGQIAAAALGRLVAGQGVQPANLTQALRQALDEKHLLVYVTDPEASLLLRRRSWDGALPDPASSSDVLFVVDTNVGFNKVDANVDRSIHYQVDLGASGGPRARLTLTYTNHSQREVEACIQESRYGDQYADMMDRCYWNYLRVYVPVGSRLLAGPEVPLPGGSLLARAGGQAQASVSPIQAGSDWAVWAAFFDLAPGMSRTLAFDYQLPPRVLEHDLGGMVRYHLLVQKQPGTGAVPLQVELLLPPIARLVDADPAGLPAVSTDLRTDRTFEVFFYERDEGGR
jgi:hypothetical protein